MQCNVVLIVLDTLREDYSAGLSKLQDKGFTKYENAIAPSNWTIPSHASMFTGKLPSAHGVHEGVGVYDGTLKQLAPPNLRAQRSGILAELAESGYVIHALTTNPLMTPVFGFPFRECEVYDDSGPITEVRRYVGESGGSWARAIYAMMRDGKTGLLARRTYKAIKRRVPWLLDRSPFEKGSDYVKSSIASWGLREPFMLYANLMEAHEPYAWNDGRPGAEATYCYLTGRRFRPKLDWQEKYKAHADLAVSHLFEILETMERLPKNTMYVVASDHGQLLGEQGRYGHGFFLDDALLRVPLYIRYPEGVQPFKQRGSSISTCEIPFIVESALYGTKAEVGSDCVASECFGPPWDLMRYARDEDERRALSSVYSRKVRCHSEGGAFTINPATGVIEDRQGGIADAEIARCLVKMWPRR